jgi:hypothetical protein
MDSQPGWRADPAETAKTWRNKLFAKRNGDCRCGSDDVIVSRAAAARAAADWSLG